MCTVAAAGLGPWSISLGLWSFTVTERVPSVLVSISFPLVSTCWITIIIMRSRLVVLALLGLLVGLLWTGGALAHDDGSHTHTDEVESTTGDSTHKFGDHFQWRTLQEGLQEVRQTGRPGFVLVHKDWCGACQRLAPLFKADEALLQKSREFVMISVDEEPDQPEYEPDGAYVPRILFTDADGQVRPDIFNVDGNMEYKYYYANPSLIVKSMTRTLETHGVQPAAAATAPASSSSGTSDEL